VQPGLHGSGGYFKYLGDLAVVQRLDIPQNDDGAMFVVQFLQSGQNQPMFLPLCGLPQG